MRLHTSCPENDALRYVNNARMPADRARLPRLVWARPQPSPLYLVAVAQPESDLSGALCVFDCRRITGNIFVLQIGSVADRQGLIIAAGLQSSPDLGSISVLFVSTQPWPVPDGARVNLVNGDLLSFVPGPAEREATADVQSILGGPAHGPEDIDFPRSMEEAAWVLYNGGDFRFEVPPERRSYVRPDIAARVQIPSNQLVIRPAAPPITDYAFRGAATRNVLAVCRGGGSHYSEPRDIIVILDARPLLLTFTWWFCPQGILALEDVARRFGNRCPVGHHVGLITAVGTLVERSTRLQVQDGEHFTVVFTALTDGVAEDLGPDDASSRRSSLDTYQSGSSPASGPTRGGGRRHDSTGGTLASTRGTPSGGSGASAAPGQRALSYASIDSVLEDADTIDNPEEVVRIRVHACKGKPCTRPGRGKHSTFIISGVIAQCAVGGEAAPALHERSSMCPRASRGDDRMSLQRPVPTPCRSPRLPQPSDGDIRFRDFWPEQFGAEHPVASDRLLFWPSGFRRCAPDSAAATILGPDLDAELAFGDLKLGFSPRDLHALFRPEFRTIPISECVNILQGPARKRLWELAHDDGQGLHPDSVCYTDGSFVPHLDPTRQRSGWACIFADKQKGRCDIVAGLIPALFLEEDCQSAFKAECCALIVALWLGVSAFQGRSFQVFSDCQAALSIANGTVAVQCGGIARLLAHVADACRSAAYGNLQISYIPGHANVLGNEIADLVAKAAAAGLPLGTLCWGLSDRPQLVV